MVARSDELLRNTQSPVTLYTVGHGARSAAEFLDAVRAFGIDYVVDVRAYPASRRHPHFSRQAFAPFLGEAGMGYRWLGEALGGFRRGASSSVHTALASAQLRAYADHMNTAPFRAGITELLALAHARPTAMLCAERQPQHCHRAMISDYLTAHGVPVIHVLDPLQAFSHQLNSAVRWGRDQLIYDRGGDGQLEWEF